MFSLSTHQKISIASIISKFLIFIFKKKEREIIRNNVKYTINLEEGIDLGIFLGIKNEKKFFNIEKIFNKKKRYIFIDIGANVGSVSLPLAYLFRKAKVISIEPTLYAYSKLKINISHNPNLKKRILALNLFISKNKKKVKKVYSSWNLTEKENKHTVHRGILKKTSNKSMTLDHVLKKIKKVDLIKIDVDGHELDVLKSGQKTLKKFKPLIHFELAPYLYREYGYNTKKIINFITKILGYEFFSEDFKKINNIREIANSITNRSENFFLIHKEKVNSLKL